MAKNIQESRNKPENIYIEKTIEHFLIVSFTPSHNS